MNNDRYNISYGPPLTVKDRPHREVNTTRSDYGLPSPDETKGDISFAETPPSEDGVEISRPNIDEMKVNLV
jgi:hypothetical protein